MTDRLLIQVKQAFPKVRPVDRPTWSPPDNNYNCIAWAAEDVSEWWWPVGDVIGSRGTPKPAYWPAGVPREKTIPAFIQAFETLGYTQCDNAQLETGFVKVALD